MIHSGGITSAKGYTAWGDHVGLKRFKKDLAFIVCQQTASLAAVFTTNHAKAAPIQWNQKVLASGKKVKAILINSGQANSCTGTQGMLNAGLMAESAAKELGCDPCEIVLASTGVIGAQIRMTEALAGIKVVAAKIRADQFAGSCAAEAIQTTDSYVKQCATSFDIGGKEVTIGAMAKGSGMVHPNMATMLAFIATDVNIAPHMLQKALKSSVESTYNMISVDGDTSTNDMVVSLANGAAGNVEIVGEGADFDKFCQALNEVNVHLAKKIASDVNGTTKRLAVTVEGAASTLDARVLARKVVSSNLVKSSIYKEEANWGRIIAAVGSAGVFIDIYTTSISLRSEKGVVMAFDAGEQHPSFSEITAKEVLSLNEIEIIIKVGSGSCTATAWGCDMEHDSIRSSSSFNKVLAGVG